MPDLVDAKYHLSVAKRMLRNYGEFPEKRFLIGVINESAKAVSSLIRAYLIYGGVVGSNVRKNMKVFMEEISPKYLDGKTRENLGRLLEVERAHKMSPVEYAKEDKIILLIGGRYRFLTSDRIGEFVKSVGDGVKNFPTGIKR